MALTRRQAIKNNKVDRPGAHNAGTDATADAITEAERRELGAAFDTGAIGEVLIGIKDEQRFLTLCLPSAEKGRATLSNLSAALDRLRRAGCERVVRVHRE